MEFIRYNEELKKFECVSPHTVKAIVALCLHNERIKAVAMIREQTGYGLKESKLIMDAIYATALAYNSVSQPTPVTSVNYGRPINTHQDLFGPD